MPLPILPADQIMTALQGYARSTEEAKAAVDKFSAKQPEAAAFFTTLNKSDALIGFMLACELIESTLEKPEVEMLELLFNGSRRAA